jgi:hypothetical protein
MNRRTRLTLSGASLFALALGAFPPAVLAQSDPYLGIWQLNLAKSKYVRGSVPKIQIVNIQGEGQNRKATLIGVDKAGNPMVLTFTEFVADGQPHPVTGAPTYDAIIFTPVDDYITHVTRTKAGQTVETGTSVISQDGMNWTNTSILGTDANGSSIVNITVYDKIASQ